MNDLVLRVETSVPIHNLYPGDWEDHAVFSAVLLAHLPARSRPALRQLGVHLYRLVLEGVSHQDWASSSQRVQGMRNECQAVLAELGNLASLAESLPRRQPLHGALSRVLARGWELYLEAARAVPEPRREVDGSFLLRPILLNLAEDPVAHQTLVALSGALGELVIQAPEDSALAAAMGEDLLWLQAFCRQHLAGRLGVSVTSRQEVSLCLFAEALAEQLQGPIELCRAPWRRAS